MPSPPSSSPSERTLKSLQQPGYDIIAQFMIGYALPGKPIANLLFKIYGRISTVHALSFLADQTYYPPEGTDAVEHKGAGESRPKEVSCSPPLAAVVSSETRAGDEMIQR